MKYYSPPKKDYPERPQIFHYNHVRDFKNGECVRCRGGQFESEGSVLKYMTEDENAAGAADRALYIVATSSADSA